MGLNLTEKSKLHINFENAIRAICKEILNPLGITYFSYLKFYNDGSSYLFNTHSNLIEYVYEHNIPVAAPISENLIKKNFHYFILPVDKYSDFLHHAREYYKLEHFIDLVDRHENYIELFCFGSNAKNNEIVNFYLNNIDFLHQFKLYFKETAADLLKNAENNKIKLPKEMYPPYIGLEKQPITKNIVQKKLTIKTDKYKNIILTPRQYECLDQLAIGCTAKEAAKNLGLSNRTIENYLANLKSMFNCHRKSELINIYLNNFK